MQVRVKLFATLSSYSPVPGGSGTPFELELPEGSCLSDLVTRLKLPDDMIKIAFVNGLVQSLDSQLHPGDDVGIFPPIGGGEI
jgi:molybdopterin synthase sulfur carrier subunit